MCGIAGWVGDVPPELMPPMLELLRHRGPDDSGAHAEPGAALGMTRLAIIDLVTGRQPMRDGDARYCLVFNGEIYNFRQLRAELEARGRRFRTQSDTEVILQAYAVFGEACVERLRGMFAFAVWDRARRVLFLARDRLGKKPLYYWQQGGVLLFASEPKALLLHPAVSRDVDWAAFHHYLAFGYTPAARSIYARILKLPPAHTATLADGRLTLRRYWRLPPGPPAGAAPAPLEETAARVREELREAVRLRLESDVPLGVFLSGGIDSSAVVASMREVTSGRIATFSIGFGRGFASFNELPHARLVAERFGTDHHEEILEPNVAELLPTIVRHFDEPFADSSAVPTFAVAQATAHLVKVALSGIGGDETFGGYPRYLGVRLSERYARLPRGVRRAAGALAQRLVRDSRASRNLGGWVRRFVAGAEEPMPDRYVGWTRFFGDAALARLASPALRARLGAGVDAAQRSAFEAHGHGDPVDGAFRIDLATYLPDDLLVMADRMSMASSLELRAPFCDHRVVEASLAIPPSVKIPGRRLKGLLKTAFAGVLPRPVLEHRKQGFMIPLGAWLAGDLRGTLEDLLAPSLVATRGLFAPAEVERLKREHLDGARDHADRLWTLMMTELWIREYLDRGGQWSLGAEGPGVARAQRVAAPAAALRILMVSDVSPARPAGGGERMLWEQASRLAARGHRVRVLSRSHPDGADGVRDVGGVHIRHFPMDRRSVAGFVRSSILAARRATTEDLAESPADVLHLHQPLAGYGALLSPAGRRLPMLYSFYSPAPLEYRARHGMTRRHRGGFAGGFGFAALWLIERACLRRARLIHVLSDFSAGQLRTLYGVARERLVKIPGAVELERFRPAADRAAVRRGLGLPERRPLLLTVRNLESRMGLDLLLHAMARLKERVPEALLLIGGAGSLRGELEALSATLGLEAHARFLGFVPDGTLPAFYQAADVFVLPTRELEGFGLVTAEALACGTPVLGTPVGATPEILAPLSPSLIFRGLAPETLAADLAGLLERVAADPAGAARLREECRRYAEARYGWDGAIAALAEALGRVAGMR